MRFHLSTLFFATLVIATSMALLGGWGFPCGIYVLAMATFFALWLTGNLRLPEVIFVLLIGLAVAALLLPPLETPRESSRRAACVNNLSQVAIALLNYHDQHGCLPPASAMGKDGKPMHSWRVQILRFRERTDLYRAYKFDEPWNGPNNRKLMEMHDPLMECPSDPNAYDSNAGVTNYFAVTGPGSVWDDYRSPQNPKRRLENDRRILLVEVAGANIPWTEPRDLTVEDLAAGINATSGISVSSRHGELGANAVLANGDVIYLPHSISPELLRELATEGLDSTRQAQLRALPRQLRDGPQYVGARFACWLLSILVYTIHIVLLGRKYRKNQAVASPQEDDNRVVDRAPQ